MPVRGPGPYQLRKLSRELRLAGTEGQGLRRELYKAINQAAKPLVQEIKDPAHLEAYMPAQYAAVLAGDLAVTAVKRGGRDPSVSIRAKGRRRKRKVQRLDGGVLTHPLFGDRGHWYDQRSHVRSGFFEDPARRRAPDIRKQVGDAMHVVAKKITTP